jgi:putative transposase
MNKYQNKYRIPSARLQNWDYRWVGAYFITICTQNREHYFGEIANGKMQLSQVGVIADILWHQITQHTQNVRLGAFVVMPNHIHGILIINENGGDGDNGGNVAVETGHALSLPTESPVQPKTIGQQRFQNIGKNSIPSIVGSYKSAVTKHAHRLDFEFQWQTRFYDHIIRNDKSFQTISDYITNNPVNWPVDKFFKPE